MSRQGDARERTTENVRDFWNNEADEWGDNPQVTIRDHYFRLHEIETISALMAGRERLLDIGCGTGFSTFFYADRVTDAHGVDYAPSMIRIAERMLADPDYRAKLTEQYSPDGAVPHKGNLKFSVGNILDLQFPAGCFDTVVAERVLINLPSQSLQDDALGQVVRVLRAAGGLLLLVEVTAEGHRRVDLLRGLVGLPPIEKYWHNLYLDESHTRTMLEKLGTKLTRMHRFETFHFLTKVVHPAIVAPAEPQFLSPFNNAARLIARRFPTFAAVAERGYARFLREDFQPQLEQAAPEMAARFADFAKTLPERVPDFSGCSHQVLFVASTN